MSGVYIRHACAPVPGAGAGGEAGGGRGGLGGDAAVDPAGARLPQPVQRYRPHQPARLPQPGQLIISPYINQNANIYRYWTLEKIFSKPNN